MPFDSLLKLDYIKWIYLLNRFDNPNPARKIAKALDDKRLEFSILQREPERMAWLEVDFSKPVTAGEYEDVGTTSVFDLCGSQTICTVLECTWTFGESLEIFGMGGLVRESDKSTANVMMMDVP
ncbi:hypothetical protein BU17DRAFT_84444 [Hysterangium stoloniferum]|nr:hypothetical protein BU17DRAFT_84444 [Hysterangium stoloniferum]